MRGLSLNKERRQPMKKNPGRKERRRLMRSRTGKAELRRREQDKLRAERKAARENKVS